MKVISPASLQSKAMDILRELEMTGEEVVVVENGQAVLKIISYRREWFDGEGEAQSRGAAA
jgi:antitoxin (DNA-binding transcriptional repressor) of toxin-antitoxin stability system